MPSPLVGPPRPGRGWCSSATARTDHSPRPGVLELPDLHSPAPASPRHCCSSRPPWPSWSSAAFEDAERSPGPRSVIPVTGGMRDPTAPDVLHLHADSFLGGVIMKDRKTRLIRMAGPLAVATLGVAGPAFAVSFENVFGPAT